MTATLHWMLQAKLRLLFAGVDDTYQADEEYFESMYTGCVVMRIFQEHSFLRALVIVLTFSASDLQRVSLSTKGEELSPEERAEYLEIVDDIYLDIEEARGLCDKTEGKLPYTAADVRTCVPAHCH